MYVYIFLSYIVWQQIFKVSQIKVGQVKMLPNRPGRYYSV